MSSANSPRVSLGLKPGREANIPGAPAQLRRRFADVRLQVCALAFGHIAGPYLKSKFAVQYEPVSHALQ